MNRRKFFGAITGLGIVGTSDVTHAANGKFLNDLTLKIGVDTSEIDGAMKKIELLEKSQNIVEGCEQVRDGSPVFGYGGVASELCRALGLDPRKTQSIHLNIDMDDVINADVRQMVTDKDMKRILAVVDKKYVLCHRPDDDKLEALGELKNL